MKNEVLPLATLLHGLTYFASLIEDFDNIDEDRSWIGDGADPIKTPPARGADFAIENYRAIARYVGELESLAVSLPACETLAEIRVTLALFFRLLGQADVPAEFVMMNGDSNEAIAIVRESSHRAWERCGHTLEALAAKVAVMADDAGQIIEMSQEKARDEQAAIAGADRRDMESSASGGAKRRTPAEVERLATQAVLLRMQNPTMAVAEIAKQVGLNHTQLSGHAIWRRGRQADRATLRPGFIDPNTGDVDAAD